MRGAYASSRTLGAGCGGRGGAKTKRIDRRTAKPCGSDAPTLAFKLATMLAHCVDDGGKKARSPGRARSKPLKPLRREGRMNPPLPVATTLVCFFNCTRGCGCGGHPVFPAPSLEGRAVPSHQERRRVQAITRARSRRGNAKLWLRLSWPYFETWRPRLLRRKSSYAA
jgi:hypothetical protein